MKNLDQFSSSIRYLFTDIDDTLTEEGQLGPEAYKALWDLQKMGIKVIPVTGRPAGWCEMIARMWPVDGVIGENGGFYFRYHQRKMHRHFFFDEDTQFKNRQKLEAIRTEVLAQVPGCAIASDQFCRLMDLAVDFCEDVPALKKEDVQRIVSIFEAHGAIAKVSSIHVNGWFGKYDKVSMTKTFLEKEYGITPEQSQTLCAFSGDSPNDEPMFAFFPHSFAVANLVAFKDQLKHLPSFIAQGKGGHGFVEIATALIQNYKK